MMIIPIAYDCAEWPLAQCAQWPDGRKARSEEVYVQLGVY
jgi:hypothetical protein